MVTLFSRSGPGRTLAAAALLAAGLAGATMPAQAEVLDARTAPASTRAPVISVNPATLPDFALFRECDECPEMVVIPAGSFEMGSPSTEAGRHIDESPQRRVSVNRFAMSRFETTWAEWEACVAERLCDNEVVNFRGGDNRWGKGRRPVMHVGWDDAVAYAGYVAGRTNGAYRLPSEAEWEYAARGGTTSAFPWGQGASREYANYGADQCCSGLASGRDQWINTAPVGQFNAGPFGLFDMHGNVWEWVEDCHAESYAGAPANGSSLVASDCQNRVMRGGSWRDEPLGLRSANRSRYPTFGRANDWGFRLSRTLSDPVLRAGTIDPAPAPVDVCEGARRDWEVVRTGSGAEALLSYERSHAGCMVYARLAREEINRRDDEAWSSAQRVNTKPGYEAYILAHGSGRYVSSARERISEIERLATRAPGTVFRDGFTSGPGEGPEMVVLPRGSFTMGSPHDETSGGPNEGPQRSVRIGYEFAVGRYEVTWREYSACVSAGACRAAADDGFGQGSRPVTNVSWEDAQAYVTWLNQKTGLTGRSDRYRLLSEAEWEYAARAGTTTPFHTGSTISTRQANYNGNFTYGSGVKGEYREKTVAAGSFPANAFGLHDMHGNVWEWVEDCSEWYSVQPSDGSAFMKNSCSSRVLRGGSWLNPPQVLRSAVRSGDSPGVRFNFLGFRVARTLP